MTLRKRIEDNVAIWLLGSLLTGFLSGVATYQAILDIAGLKPVAEARLDDANPGARNARTQSLAVTIGEAGHQETSLTLARLPVVLVHGLFSDPIKTWVDTFPDGASMVAHLERSGFLPFMVNFNLVGKLTVNQYQRGAR